VAVEAKHVRSLIEKYRGQKWALVQILLDIQDNLHWLPPEAMEAVAETLDIPLVHVFGVATFYKSFSLEPRGRHLCTVCMGTACHVRGGATVLEHLERRLGIPAGETTPDGDFTLERVNCLGACALAPLVVVDGRYYGQMTETKANSVLENARKAPAPEEQRLG
jgi:NADH:ubiquinone oxidoreductase subunit E